ncbi:hypothetical protein NDU88_007556 [Pleurodeles waltl]|uniref:Uncharacterized protein n=1 Tax=Pleurodeles waltl TaxID=8319 RepID=A0AAV7U2M5_PLEWA|nr:hypothetical protein NDU88_007556 [Pleurodeles waltl]
MLLPAGRSARPTSLEPHAAARASYASDVSFTTHPVPFTWNLVLRLASKGREAINKLVRPWMCEGKFLSEKRKHALEKRKQAQSKYVEEGKNRERNVEVGDWVRIRLPGIIAKGSSKFSVPKKVVEVKRCLVKLEDGKWWNKKG